MDIAIAETRGIPVVELTGDLDADTAPELQEQIMPLVNEHSALILDLRNVAVISSAGLRVLLRLHRHTGSHRAHTSSGNTVHLRATHHMALVGVPDHVRDTMQITGFLRFFILADSTDDAINQLTGETTRE
jgi:anti-sigma B factor antagonist